MTRWSMTLDLHNFMYGNTVQRYLCSRYCLCTNLWISHGSTCFIRYL